MKWKKFFACLLLGAAVLPAEAGEGLITGRASVVDGDTLEIGSVRIRLFGIDAPEAGQTCRNRAGKSWQCGSEAANRLSELIEDSELACRPRDRDVYGRIIASCEAGGIDVNGQLIAEGLAWAFIRYSDEYAPVEAKARSAAVGIWNGTAEAPWDYRANRWERAAEASPRHGCPIKGNINNKNEKIYHTPWSPAYKRTKINEAAGERWFCDEEEAIAAGWRAPHWK